MRINMQTAIASFQGQSYLATAAQAATRPIIPSLPDSWSPAPERPQETFPECESVIWLRSAIEGDKATAEAVRDPSEISVGAEFVDHCGSDEAAEYIRRHDPRDAIARCEADLKVLDLHGPNRYGYCLTCDPDSCGCVGSGDYPCATVCTILAGYRHREGFKPEWVTA